MKKLLTFTSSLVAMGIVATLLVTQMNKPMALTQDFDESLAVNLAVNDVVNQEEETSVIATVASEEEFVKLTKANEAFQETEEAELKVTTAETSAELTSVTEAVSLETEVFLLNRSADLEVMMSPEPTRSVEETSTTQIPSSSTSVSETLVSEDTVDIIPFADAEVIEEETSLSEASEITSELTTILETKVEETTSETSLELEETTETSTEESLNETTEESTEEETDLSTEESTVLETEEEILETSLTELTEETSEVHSETSSEATTVEETRETTEETTRPTTTRETTEETTRPTTTRETTEETTRPTTTRETAEETTRPTTTRETTEETTRPTTTRETTEEITRPTTGETSTETSTSETPVITTETSTTAPTTSTETTTEPSTEPTTSETTVEETSPSTEEEVPVYNQAPYWKQVEILNLVNYYRSMYGLAPVSLASDYAHAAQTRAEEIMYRPAHYRPDGRFYRTVFLDYGLTNFYSQENYVYQFGPYSAERAMNWWMNSYSHRNTILNSRFTHVAIGVFEYNGASYYTQIFLDKDTISGNYNWYY